MGIKPVTALPSASDFNVYNTLDEMAACKNFLGKTIAEAEQMLSKLPDYHYADFAYMGPKAFEFYMQAAINCVKVATDDAVIGAMHTAISMRVDAKDLTLGTERVLEMIDYIIEHFDQFKGEDDLYMGRVDLKAAYIQLRDQIRAQSPVLS